MCINDSAANCQAHAHTVLFRSEESFEDFFRVLQAYAAILYLDQNGLRTVSFRTDEEFLGTVKDRVHRLDTVEEQVENHLLQLHAIARYGAQVLVQISLHGDAPFRSLAAQKTEHLGDDLIQIEIDFIEGRVLEKGADAPYHFSRFCAVADNSCGSLLHFSQAGRLRRKPAQTGMTVRYHCGEGLVDFVCDGSGDFSKCGRPCGSRQSSLAAAKGFLHILPVIDIDQQSVPASHSAFVVARCLAEYLKPSIDSIGPAESA